MTDLDRGKDFEPDIYATHEEDYDEFDVEEEEEGGSRAALILIVVIAVVLLLGVGYVSYRMGFENGQRVASVPRLHAAAEGGKVQPDDPGGLAQPQESALDESIIGEGENEFAQLLPNEEEVIELPNDGGQGESEAGIEIPKVIGADPDLAASEPEDAPDSVPVEAAPPPKPAAEPKPVEPEPAPEPQPAASSRIMVPKPGGAPSGGSSTSGAGSSGSADVPSPSSSAPSASVPAPSPETIPAPSAAVPSGPAPTPGPMGEYVIQLASLPSMEAANAAWRNTSAKYSDLIGSAMRDIEEADLGDRGIFYRLRVGYFQSRTEANRLCETLKSRGQDCLVKSR